MQVRFLLLSGSIQTNKRKGNIMTDYKGVALLKVDTCLKKAEDFYGIEFPMPRVRFNMNGKSAGQVRVTGDSLVVRFNPTLLKENTRPFIESVIPHEMAHYIVICKAIHQGLPIPKPHGMAWKSVMVGMFQLEPKTRHSFSVANVGRKVRRVTYACGCQTHEITVRMHNQLKAGRGATCRHCHDKIEYVKGD